MSEVVWYPLTSCTMNNMFSNVVDDDDDNDHVCVATDIHSHLVLYLFVCIFFGNKLEVVWLLLLVG